MSLMSMDICWSCQMQECHKCDGYTAMRHLCQHGCAMKEFAIKDFRVAYFPFWDLVDRLPDPDNKLRKFLTDYYDWFVDAQGSSHNHQAWKGGFLHHTVETMNIALQLFDTLSQLRPLPFKIEDALMVMLLHDIEKPFKSPERWEMPISLLGKSWREYLNGVHYTPKVKTARRKFRTDIINAAGIILTDEQWRALEYVEGEREDYTPGTRLMNELGAFCHSCDILSARLWHDRGDGKGWSDKQILKVIAGPNHEKLALLTFNPSGIKRLTVEGRFDGSTDKD